MRTSVWIGVVSSVFLTSCSLLTPDVPDVPPSLDREALHDRFHGKYEVVSSQSSEPVDLNFDGKASTDLKTEIVQLGREYRVFLELRLYGKDKVIKPGDFLFLQWWPEQTIYLGYPKGHWRGEPLAYDPSLLVNYNQDGVIRTFSFSSDLNTIQVEDREDDDLVWQRKPLSVKVIGEHVIEIVNKKTLYTRTGLKEVTITTRYERYTMTT